MATIYRGLVRAETLVAAAFLLAMVLLILLGGFARLARHPLNWTTDLATCLFAWACFLSADIAWRKKNLMSIDLFTRHAPVGARRALEVINYLLIAAFLLFLSGAGLWLSWVSRARSFQGIPGVSYSWVTMSLAVGSALLLLTTILKLRDTLSGRAPAAQGGDRVSGYD